MDSQVLNIGVIGCGTIAERMLAAWYPHMRNARLVAAADVNAARTEVFRSRFGVEHKYADYRDLLSASDVDAVLVLTPNFLHAEQSIAAAQAGKHVLCQKPMAMNLEEARAMIDAADMNGVTLMAAFVKRFWPYYAKVRDLIDQGVLGRIVSIRTQFSHSGIGKYYKPASDWFLDPAKAGGGPLADLGVHHFDVLRWMAGAEVTEVTALMSGMDDAGSLEDNALVNLRFANGMLAQGYYSFTTIAPPGVTIERLDVFGTNGTVMVNLAHPGRVTVQLSVESGPGSEFGGWIDVPVLEPVPAFGLMLQHFVDAIQAGQIPVTTGEDGYRSIEISQAAYLSARDGERVQLHHG